jgi:SEC-C motif domain protein
MACLCGLPGSYRDCCGRLHRGESAAKTAEQLMRSRFSAFSVADEAYLLRTWHPSTRPQHIPFDKALHWVRLEILASTGGTPIHTEATVHFRAHYTTHGKPGHMEETSHFTRHNGHWTYTRPA